MFVEQPLASAGSAKDLQAKGRLTLWEPEPCQNRGGALHPRSDPNAYTKPGRMVSLVLDRVLFMMLLNKNLKFTKKILTYTQVC